MKYLAFSSLSLGLIFAQSVGIGTATPHIGTRLHVQGDGTQGVIFPQVALSAANVWAPVAGAPTDGMLVYNTATAGSGVNAVSPGYYYWQGGTTGRWQRFTGNGYAGMVQGVLANPGQNLFTYHPAMQYLNAYIDLPPGRWIVFSTQLLRTTDGSGVLPMNASIWVRTTFSESNTSPMPSSDIIGSQLISGILPPQSKFGLVTGQVLIHNSSGTTKRYYYWGSKDAHNTGDDLLGFATTTWQENQLFALPAE